MVGVVGGARECYGHAVLFNNLIKYLYSSLEQNRLVLMRGLSFGLGSAYSQ